MRSHSKKLTDRVAATTSQRRLWWYRWVVFATVSSSGMLMYFHIAGGATLSRYHTLAWNLNASQLGLLSALSFVPLALVQIPGGYLTDLIGARKMLAATALLLAVGTATFASAPSFAVAVFGRAIIGASIGVIFVGALKILARWFHDREYATVQGAFILLGTLGSFLATVPLAAAAERWGWRPPMWGVAGITGLIAAATWLLVRNSPVELGLGSINSIDQAARVKPAPPSSQLPSFRDGIHAFLRLPTLWAITFVLFTTTGALWSFQSLWAGPLLRHAAGLSVAQTAVALAMLTLGKALGPTLFGFVSDHLRARKPVVVFAVLAQTGLWCLLILAFDHLPLHALYLAFAGLSALHGGILVTQVMIKELSPPHLFGTIYGLINGAGFYGTALLQFVTGFILGTIGPITVAPEPVYPAVAYKVALSPIIVFMFAAVLAAFRLNETLNDPKLGFKRREYDQR